MTRDALMDLGLAVTLTALAGFVDAIGFLRLGHLFVSFMSGDSTQLAVAASQGDWGKAAPVGAVVALFVAGVAAGRGLAAAAKARSRPVVLMTEAALLGAAALCGSLPVAVALMVLAMGVQNAAVHRAGGVRTSLTYVTGTLVKLGEGLADACGPHPTEGRWGWMPYLALWAGLAAGATLGALAFGRLGMTALWIAAAAAALLAGAAVASTRRGG